MNRNGLLQVEATVLALRKGIYAASRRPFKAVASTALITIERVKRIEAKAEKRMMLKRNNLLKN